ncbi:nucleotidyltransferase domain-containing protein [Clostridium thermobutyricum]|uniref:Polymerase nucleotidyl transferase domain-containing protein n=1 Tax=Clostridium thermobutyricum TaxID=29372 RepID=N9XVK4_9CLOT|nr:nucleotidyltransferase domain-containing protein [Clostridium thermobutyricum]ENY99983.1 hypothetical protein HMPREF1092_03120 [Clostridium thermobutyricum]
MRKEPIEEIKLADLKGIKNKNIISLATFGSFNTKYWRNGFSDIDILVLIEHRNDVMEEFDIEDEIIPILEKHFEYNKIHLTFLEMKEFDTVFARQYIDSKDKLILNELKEMDFRIYVNKYIRNNKNLSRGLKGE